MPRKCYTCPVEVPIKKGGGRRPPPRRQDKAPKTKPQQKDKADPENVTHAPPKFLFKKWWPLDTTKKTRQGADDKTSTEKPGRPRKCYTCHAQIPILKKVWPQAATKKTRGGPENKTAAERPNMPRKCYTCPAQVLL